MKIKKQFLSVCLIAICTIHAQSQTIEHPNYALKSHETLEIVKVELTLDKTLLYLSIENRIERGTFCADRNIYLLDPEGKKFELKKSSGIPTCPDSYKFKSIGEKLQFTLEFPPFKPGTKWIDIIEDCNNNCFSFYGVILDNDLNKKLDEGFALAEKGESSKAIIIFKEILSNTYDRVNGVAGALYTEIITMENKSGNIAGATEWYKKLLSSNIPRLDLYIKNLNSRGVKF